MERFTSGREGSSEALQTVSGRRVLSASDEETADLAGECSFFAA